MPQRTLTTITSPAEERDATKNSQIAVNQQLALPTTPIAPYNFKATNQRGGILLNWSPLIPQQGSTASPVTNRLPAADGYELQRSDTGDFSVGSYISIPIRDPAQSSYFDSLGGAVQTKYYKLRATNGTAGNSYAVHGIFTGVVKHTSIDASDTMTVPTTNYDTFTSQKTQARARAWKSGTLYPNNR